MNINSCKHHKILLWTLLMMLGISVLLTPRVFATTAIPTKPMLMLAANTFIYNPRSLTWRAISNGRVIKSGKGSGGSNYCRDLRRPCRTPTGSYTVISKRGADCQSSVYPLGRGGAKMPYCTFFTNKYAVHGSYDVPNRNASHGCVRIHPQDARWLYQNFFRVGTRIIIQPY